MTLLRALWMAFVYLIKGFKKGHRKRRYPQE